jgi:hypothetical protein
VKDRELEALPMVIVVCAVATDVCVKHASHGFLARHYWVNPAD